MKKPKILIPSISMVAAISTIAPIMSSCGVDPIITPTVDQETQANFANINFNCELNKESTIVFVPKDGEELVESSLVIKIENNSLNIKEDYTVVGNTVKIFAHAMTSKNMSVKANSQTIHFEPTITEETKSQFESITSNCHIDQDSTIAFVPKQDQEIDPLSVSIVIDQVKLEETKDYKIHNNIITIYASAMKSRNINVSVSARYQHVIDCLEPSWIVKPLMTNDSMTANDVIVYLNYKDGTQETLDWGEEGYEIYWVKKDGSKVKLENFKTTPFVFTIPGQEYNFEIVYSKDTRVKLATSPVVVNEPTETLFFTKYKQCLDNFKESEIYNKYGWITFDQGSKFMDEDVVSAALVYEYNGARAYFKDNKGEPTDYDCIFGGLDIDQFKEWFDEYRYDNYIMKFINTSTEFGFRISKTATPTEYNEVLFNKECYITNWTNTMTDEVGEPYQNTKITNIKYTDYVKTVQLNAKIDSNDPIDTLNVYDTIVQTQEKKFLTEVDNEFILKVSSKGETRTGKVVVYNKGTAVYESSQMTINGTETEMKIKISDWDKIDHNDTLTVRFIANEAFKLSLDSSLSDKYIWKVDEPVLIESTKESFSANIYPKSIPYTEAGTFYISAMIDGEEKILSRTEFCDDSQPVFYATFNFDYTTWATIGKKSIINATVKFAQPRVANLSIGSNLSKIGATLTPSDKIIEDYIASKIKITLTSALSKDTVFTITNTRTSEDLVLTSIPAGETEIWLSFDKWDNIETGDTLKIDSKVESKLQVTCENDTYKLKEPQPGEQQFVQILLAPGYFKYSDPEQEWHDTAHWDVKISNWKQTVGPTSGWKLFADWWHSCTKIGEEWLRVELFADGEITPHEGDEYTFDITLVFNGEETYQEFTFKDMKIQVYWPY